LKNVLSLSVMPTVMMELGHTSPRQRNKENQQKSLKIGGVVSTEWYRTVYPARLILTANIILNYSALATQHRPFQPGRNSVSSNRIIRLLKVCPI
jgi:hypothetical protein